MLVKTITNKYNEFAHLLDIPLPEGMQRAQQAHMEQAHEAAEQAAVIAPKADEAISHRIIWSYLEFLF